MSSFLIHHGIMVYLFVPDDSSTSKRFTTRTEQLTKCCEPLQKVSVRLGSCKPSLRTPVISFKAILLWWF